MNFMHKVPCLLTAVLALSLKGCIPISQPFTPLKSATLEKMDWNYLPLSASAGNQNPNSSLAVGSDNLVETKAFYLDYSYLQYRKLPIIRHPLVSVLYFSDLNLAAADIRRQYEKKQAGQQDCISPSAGCSQQTGETQPLSSPAQMLREERAHMAWVAVDSKGKVYLSGKQGKVLTAGLDLSTRIAMQNISTLWDQDPKNPDLSLIQPQMVHGLAIGPDDVLYFSDPLSHQIFKVVNRKLIAVLNPQNSQFANTQTKVSLEPSTLDLDAAGNLYFLEWGGHRVLKLSQRGELTVLAGGQEPGFQDGKASAARFNAPYDLAVTVSGDVLVSDTMNHRIRKISPEGQVTTLLGSGDALNLEGPLSEAKIASPQGIDIGQDGIIYVLSRGESYRFRLE